MLAFRFNLKQWNTQSFRYTAVLSQNSSDSDIDTEKAQTTIESKGSQYGRSITTCVLGITLVCLVTAAFYKFREQPIDFCGTTAAEARANGCVFELIGSSWVTPECYDPVTEQEFLEYRDWHFYKDYNQTQEATIEEVRQGEGYGYFVSHFYHSTHCGFLIKKLHRAIDAGRKLDGLITAFHHTNHCVHWMLDPPEYMLNFPQFAYTKFPNCGREGGFNLDGSVMPPGMVGGELEAHQAHIHDA